MLRITIERVPSGDLPRELVGTVDVVDDDTGTAEIGNYDVTACDAAGREVRSVLEDVRRKEGVWALAADALTEAVAARLLAGEDRGGVL